VQGWLDGRATLEKASQLTRSCWDVLWEGHHDCNRRGGSGPRASLLTWHRRLGHLSFKTVVELAQEGASGLEITDVPARIPGLDACSTCVAVEVHVICTHLRKSSVEHTFSASRINEPKSFLYSSAKGLLLNRRKSAVLITARATRSPYMIGGTV